MWGFIAWLIAWFGGGDGPSTNAQGDFGGNGSLHHGARGRGGRVRDRSYHR